MVGFTLSIIVGIYLALQLDLITRVLVGYFTGKSIAKRYQAELTRVEHEIRLNQSRSGNALSIN